MNGKKIEIVLHTPILLRVGEGDQADKVREEAVFRIIGTVESFSETGILIEILELTGNKNAKVASANTSLFIPFHKIDHFFVIG